MTPLPWQAFLKLVVERLEDGTSSELRPWHARIRHRMLQVHYGNPRVHYELWLQTRTGRVEIGLHFEDERSLNERWCALLAPLACELREALGPELDLEEWTASWMRLHLTVPMEPLTAEFASDLAGRFGALIAGTADVTRRRAAETVPP
jgi:hypothetical protein